MLSSVLLPAGVLAWIGLSIAAVGILLRHRAADETGDDDWQYSTEQFDD